MIAVAVDGPAGAGKSTVARAAAKELGFVYVDTGALYRAIGLHVLRRGIDPASAEQVVSQLSGIQLSLAFCQGEQQVLLCGEDVSGSIRTPEVSMAASKVSAIPQVRAFLFDLQRDLARTQSVIMDGRDIGTVVLPNAQVKVFLTASDQVRARRRFDELRQKGETVEYEQVLKDIQQRDYQDSHREIAPLVPAPDAVLLDTSNDTPQQAVDRLVALVREKMRRLEEEAQ